MESTTHHTPLLYLPVEVEPRGEIVFDDERVEGLNVGIESEIFLRRNVLTPGRTVG